MALESTDDLANLYGELQKAIKRQDYNIVTKVASDILKKYPDEEKAYQCKVIALINQDKHEDCLHLFKSFPQFSKNQAFEKAYCEYRLNRVKDAYATITSSPVAEAKHLELLAQILYRMENYEEAQARYRQIIKNTLSTDESNSERQANLAAVTAAMSYINNQTADVTNLSASYFPHNTHEQVFNYACYLIGVKKFDVAMQKLKLAEEMCLAYFADDPDMDEAGINEELAPIKVQQAFCLQQQSKNDEALGIYQEIIKQKPSDVSIIAVAANNIVCINRDQNIFDSKKRIKMATADILKHKLISSQSAAIACNQCLLNMYGNQFEACKRTSLAMQSWPEFKTNIRPAVIYVAQLLKDHDINKAVQFLVGYCSSNPSLFEARLLLAQLYLTQGAISSCLAQLNLLPENLFYQPAVIATLVVLYESIENHDLASQHFAKALAWHQKSGSGQDPGTANFTVQLLKASAHYHLRHGMFTQAAVQYEQLWKQFPGDQKILARLIHAYSHFDENKAKQYSKGLNLGGDNKSLDVNALETAMIYSSKYTKKMEKASAALSTPDIKKTPEQEKKRHARKKKGRMPKHFDPNVLPDPERWKPRKERSYYRGRKKDKRKDNINRGPQGQTGANYDLDKTVTTAASSSGVSRNPKSTPSSANQGGVPAPITGTTTAPVDDASGQPGVGVKPAQAKSSTSASAKQNLNKKKKANKRK